MAAILVFDDFHCGALEALTRKQAVKKRKPCIVSWKIDKETRMERIEGTESQEMAPNWLCLGSVFG